MRIAVVPGDGIGVDVTREAVKVLEKVASLRAFPFEPVFFPWSADHYLATGETVPPGAFDDLARNFDAIFMGAFGDPRVPDMRHAAEILLGARFVLDLYVNYRPVRCLDDRLCPLKRFSASEVDFVVFRENTEGSYVGAGGHLKKGTSDEVAVQEDVSTRKGVERIVRYAFEYARSRRRKRVVMRDLALIVDALEKTVTTIFHHRIDYPGFDFEPERTKRKVETPAPPAVAGGAGLPPAGRPA